MVDLLRIQTTHHTQWRRLPLMQQKRCANEAKSMFYPPPLSVIVVNGTQLDTAVNAFVSFGRCRFLPFVQINSANSNNYCKS